MAAIAPIVIVDGKATPVSHTLNPVASNPTALYREATSGLAQIGQVWASIQRTKSSKDLDKVRLILSVPALEAASGVNASGYTAAPKVAYETKADITVFLPTRSTPAQNKDLRIMLSNLLLNAQVADVIENGAVPY